MHTTHLCTLGFTTIRITCTCSGTMHIILLMTKLHGKKYRNLNENYQLWSWSHTDRNFEIYTRKECIVNLFFMEEPKTSKKNFFSLILVILSHRSGVQWIFALHLKLNWNIFEMLHWPQKMKICPSFEILIESVFIAKQ